MRAIGATGLAVLAFAVVFTLSSSEASAQQQQQQQQQPHPQARSSNMFPMSAANYEAMVQKILAKARQLRPVGPVTQGDINHGVLLYRDCTANAEADGVVTTGEATYCSNVLKNFQRDKMHEIMMSSSPDQWKQWMQQAAAANRH